MLFHSHLLNTVYSHVCPKSSSTQELQLTLLSLASLAQQLLISDGSRAKSDGTLLPAVGADAMTNIGLRQENTDMNMENTDMDMENMDKDMNMENKDMEMDIGLLFAGKEREGHFQGKKTLKTALGMLVTDVLDRRGF